MNKCRICGSKNTNKILTSGNVHGRRVLDGKEKFDIYSCRDCSGMFLKSSGNYKKYYTKDYFKSSLKKSNRFFRILVKVSERYSFRKKERLILDYFKNNRSKIKILDIGCGEGKFLENLNENKFEKKGLEINKEAGDVCCKKGLVVTNSGFLKANFEKEKYDVISMWHVLEHLEKPTAVLKKVYNLLTDEGVLIVSTPNTDSLGFKIGKENWFHLDTPRHLIWYNRKSFEFLCKKTNLEVVKVRNEFYDYYTDFFWSIGNYSLKFLFYFLYPFIKIFSKETITIVCKKNEKNYY